MDKRSKGRDFKYYVHKFNLVGKRYPRELPDLIFIYTVLSMILLAVISMLVNILLNLPQSVLYFNYSIIGILVLFYFWTARSKNIKLIRYLFLLVAIYATVYLWFHTEGSSGPSILLFQSYLTILVFVSIGREFNIILGVLLFTTVILFLFEHFYPEYITAYQSQNQKTWDVLCMVLLLFMVEIPLLIYARNNLFKERNQALQTAESKSFLLANVSHEIRTPMNAIIGFTELMTDPNIEKQERDNYLSIVNQNSRTLMNLLNNVINVSKFESGSALVYLSKVNANKVIKYVHDTLSPLCTKCDTELKLEYIEENKSIIEVDENLLFQIMMNLGYNAIKFTKNGTVTFKVYKSNEYMIFSVKDTGCGIPDNHQYDLFERFKQVNNSVNMVPSNGAGLGLSICKGLTDLLQGEIGFTSKEHEGSEFFVKLPIESPIK